jgi:glycosyl transferase family 2
MKVALTLLVRDEADIVDTQIAFHLSAGVDLVIATDHRSVDGTTEILEGYEREGRLYLIRERDEGLRQSDYVTRMARLAATELGADWIIHSDADEFWWPRAGSLKDVLGAIPARYGTVRGVWRSFPPRPDDGRFFADRMTVRLAAQAPIHDPTSPFRPNAKIAHRADPAITVAGGNHDVHSRILAPLRGWYPFEVFHFPIRSLAQAERKYVTTFTAWDTRREPAPFVARAYEEHRAGRLDAYYDALAVDDETLERGLEDGTLAVDTRLRDALRALRGSTAPAFPRSELAEEAALAVDVALLDEADVVRLQRRADVFESRLDAFEARALRRQLRGVPRRLLGRA